MKLKTQLLLISIVMLGLPWAGCQSIKEITQVLATSQEQMLANSLASAALVLQQQPSALRQPHPSTFGAAVYAVKAKDQIQLDGYANDWQQPQPPSLQWQAKPQQKALKLSAQIQDKYLYLWIQLNTDKPRYNQPQATQWQQIVLQGLNQQGEIIHYPIQVSGAGEFYLNATNAKTTSRHQALGFWRENEQGADIELKLPFSDFAQGLGLDWQIYQREFSKAINAHPLADVEDSVSEKKIFSLGTQGSLRPLLHQNDELTALLTPLVQQGIQLALVDQQGWLLSEVSGPKVNRDIPGFWLMEKVYAWLQQNDTQPQWRDLFERNQLVYPEFVSQFKQPTWFKQGYRSHLLMVEPIQVNQHSQYYLIASQGGEVLIRLAGSSFNRLLFISLIAFCVIVLGLLSYATWLTWRVNRLSASAAAQMNQDSEFNGNLPLMQSQDELGELARNFNQLLTLKQQQTDYLSSLASKLSHELRTPLAVIRSSLDNLNHLGVSHDEQSIFITRASDGCRRLSQIITAMSEAKRLEQSLNDFECDQVKVAELLHELSQAYQHTWPEQRIEFINQLDDDFTAWIYPELVVQALDKLVDNAIDFATPGTTITLTLSKDELNWQINVYNQGQALPEQHGLTIFDSLVSMRSDEMPKAEPDKSHLGLGLYIVSIIQKHHQGTCKAYNAQQGVVFSLQYPLVSKGEAISKP
ncbi:ATP-binding protein [Motilimonas sp. KMU-193]|uniref:ATP-binding protein n=1 Tax=Motilimonas sp. KMU-193 TaxID=3388668 RepID=UPI00396B1F7C